ncbi:helix-hairpin-helix domain-containing protein [Halococcus hamelinensis]|uniref:PASTA domain containing protein n=1 Tax=Halococcus hamelinensis 100A6 TaxID=1132509 RepID=M0LVZ5_9EURY|nr:helix-hairpin-helix domain-containing protein [Halococcus hamelinensis]EMA37631.1 PASTA domain containing protein [Halococcus hamelinensis 100A6]
MVDSETAESKLTVVCTDGTTIGCTNFEAIENGLLLTEDEERNRVFGFVSENEVRFVLPTTTAQQLVSGTKSEDRYNDPLTRISGIGSTYADRLRSTGYTSVSGVATAKPDELAEATETNENRASEWVERARQIDTDAEAEGST